MSIFTAFLKNKNIIFKIRRSKVRDYAALNWHARTILLCFNNLELWTQTVSSLTLI